MTIFKCVTRLRKKGEKNRENTIYHLLTITKLVTLLTAIYDDPQFSGLFFGLRGRLIRVDRWYTVLAISRFDTCLLSFILSNDCRYVISYFMWETGVTMILLLDATKNQ